MTEDKPLGQILADAMSRQPAPVDPGNFPGRYIAPLFYNQFYVVLDPATVRLTLGEKVFDGQEPNFTSAVVIPTDIAIDLAQKILHLARNQGITTAEQEADGKQE